MADYEAIAKKIIEKERAVAVRNRGRVPYTTKEPHVFDDHSAKDAISWWTNGFWGGMMWQLYAATKEELFKENALDVEKKLDAVLLDYDGSDHDAGFRWLMTAVADHRLTGDASSKNRGLLAALDLAGRFNINGSFIRAWNDFGDGRDTTGWAIIDCMMNLPLLYWASEELKDPRFAAIAVAHADTAAEYFVREDGSVRHIVGFDPATGAFLKEHGGQGIGEGTSWTRGQSWALYGFALSYLHTGFTDYLQVAQRIAERYIERIPADGLIPVDFDQAADCPWHDDTSAAIAACGLLTLSRLYSGRAPLKPGIDLQQNRLRSADPSGYETDAARAEQYRKAAEKLLDALDASEADYDPAHDELLKRCTAAYHDEKHEFPIIYGDYYYIEAIWKLTDREIFLW